MGAAAVRERMAIPPLLTLPFPPGRAAVRDRASRSLNRNEQDATH